MSQQKIFSMFLHPLQLISIEIDIVFSWESLSLLYSFAFSFVLLSSLTEGLKIWATVDCNNSIRPRIIPKTKHVKCGDDGGEGCFIFSLLFREGETNNFTKIAKWRQAHAFDVDEGTWHSAQRELFSSSFCAVAQWFFNVMKTHRYLQHESSSSMDR